MIGVSLVHEVGGHDADNVLIVVGQCLVMEHEWPIEGVDQLQKLMRGGNHPSSRGMVLHALTITHPHDILD